MPLLSVSWHGSKGYYHKVSPLSFLTLRPVLFETQKSMSKYNYAPGAIHIDHHKDLNIDVKSVDDAIRLMSAFMSDRAEDIVDITPSEQTGSVDSFIFTKKAKMEHKEPDIIKALQKSVQGRKDKTRAFVQELHEWQNQAYVDAQYNARVMYDELEKLMPISFGYDGFRRLYNKSRV